MLLKIRILIFSLFQIIALSLGGISHAQPQDRDEVEINLADKSDLDLSALVQWLAEEKDLRVIANSTTFPANAANKVVFYGNVRVDADAMLDIVQSILRTNGFALVKSDVDDFYQVLKLPEIRPFTPLIQPGEEERFQPAEYVTGVFPLEHVTQTDAINYVKQLLYGTATDTGASNITGIGDRNLIVVTETANRLARINALLRRIDIPAPATVRNFYQVKNLQAEDLKQQLEQILPGASSSSGNATEGNPDSDGQQIRFLKIDSILRTNQLLLSGTQTQIDEALEIIENLDVSTQLDLRKYNFQNISAKKIDDLIRQSLGNLEQDELDRIYQSSISEQSNDLVVTTRDEIHQQIEQLKKRFDVPESAADRQSPMRFYTLKNVKAIDILETLQSVERRFRSRQTQGVRRNPPLNGLTVNPEFSGNEVDTRLSDDLGQGSLTFDPFANLRRQEQALLQRDQFGPGELVAGGAFGNSVVGDIARLTAEFSEVTPVIPGEAKITIDENTNTLIVVAEPAIQQLYKELIERLDVRRPQVLIEVIVVMISGQDDFSFGIEVSGGDREGEKRLFSFTNFGLSEEISGENGFLTISPGLGFNGTLVNPDVADVVIRALSRHRRARVIAAPKILVNDNSTGILRSVEEVPFASVNAGNTVSTTSLAGFSEAGTTVSVTPQISEEDYLNLEFDILVNSFTGAASANLPPPKATDQVASQVSIPDGHTVIVGGLTRERMAGDLTGLPVIEKIPIINRLTSNEATEDAESRLFVFIKPVILRNDKFRDLRFLSEEERQQACIPDDLPSSQPLLIR